MSQAEQPDQLKTKIEKWLTEVGYPLECRVAATLERNGFKAEQGIFLADKNSDKLREIDALGVASIGDASSIMNVALVVECKWSDANPWVAFSSKSPLRSSQMNLFASLPLSCQVGEAVLWTSLANQSLGELSMFSAQERTPFSIRRAFTKEKGDDQCYSAIQGVVSAARTGVENLRSATPNNILAPFLMWLVRPVIVIKAPLVEAYLATNGLDFVIEPRPWLRLAWRGAFAASTHVVVDVVTEDGLGEYLATITKCLDSVYAILKTSHAAVVRALFDNDLSPVYALRKGLLNNQVPPLLARLQPK